MTGAVSSSCCPHSGVACVPGSVPECSLDRSSGIQILSPSGI